MTASTGRILVMAGIFAFAGQRPAVAQMQPQPLQPGFKAPPRRAAPKTGEELLPSPRLTIPQPGEEVLPPPRSVQPGVPAIPEPGRWIGPDGALWKFDGLRWKVLWENGQWYPAIPPGPLPVWKTVDFGMGWKGILPPNTSIWHVMPPSLAQMPPETALPPLPPPMPITHRTSYRWRFFRD